MAPAQTQKKRILIVEDEGLIARDIEIRVRKAGYDVAGVADSGEAALELMPEASPDLILMDIRLRGAMDGIETAREIQQRFDIPVIYLTAHTDRETLERARITEPFGYLAKPVAQASLPTSIEVALYKHRVEREIRQERAWLRTTLATMPDAVIVTDHVGRVQYLNSAAETLTGWSSGHALRLPLSQVLKLFHPPYGQWFNDQLPTAMLEEKSSVFPSGLKLVNRDGGEIPVAGEIAHSTEDGTPLGSVITFRDHTTKQQEEQELRHGQKMEAVGRLAAGVAHDFNNFLTVILGHASLLLEREPQLTGKTRQSLEEIRHAGTTAAAIARQLLTFSRNQVAEPRLVNLNTVIQENEDLCRRLAGDGIRWTLSLDPRLRLVLADPGHLAQVLVNLVVNARDAMPEGGTLTIATGNVEAGKTSELGTDAGDHAMLSVTDTGSGMDSATAEHIFEPFFTTKPAGHGAGLGLSIIYNIVNGLGGTISVHSQPGKGSAFCVFVPIAERMPIAEPEDEANFLDLEAPQARTILVADDNIQVRTILREFLEGRGYRVLVAADGAQALEIAAAHHGSIDALVTDVVMPRMNGFQLAEKLALLRPGVKTLFVSGYTNDLATGKSIPPANARFLEKPFLHSDLLAEVERLFGDERSAAAAAAAGWVV